MIKRFLFSFILLFSFLNSSLAINEYIKKAHSATDKNTADAVFYYKKSIEEYPRDIHAYIGLARVRLKQEEYVKALTNLLKAKDLDADNFDVNYYLGEYHYKRTNFYKAVKYYKKAQEIRLNKDEKLWVKMGKTYEKLGDTQKAKNSYINALSLNNNNMSTLNSLKRLDKLVQKQEHRY